MSHLHNKHCCFHNGHASGGHKGVEAPAVINYSQCKCHDECKAEEQEIVEPVNNTLSFATYGDVSRANQYLAKRLHSRKWRKKNPEERECLLIEAARIIDSLCYSGDKSIPEQPLEFPRNGTTTIPGDIETAAYEIALALASGSRPDNDLASLRVTSVGMSSVRTTYSQDFDLLEHTLNGVPSAYAFRLLKPYLQTNTDIELKKV